MRRVTLAFVIAVAGMCCRHAQAQFGTAASTPESAAAASFADMIRSQGMYNQMTAEGILRVEQARGKYIDNQRHWTDLYLYRKRVLEAQRTELIQLARARNERYLAYEANRRAQRLPLQSYEMDSTTGKVFWPAALQRDVFTAPRLELEELFARRAQSGPTSELNQAIHLKTRQLHDLLRSQIRDIVTDEYLAARKFLDRLDSESRLVLTSQASLQ